MLWDFQNVLEFGIKLGSNIFCVPILFENSAVPVAGVCRYSSVISFWEGSK